jgi:hypothetical protein
VAELIERIVREAEAALGRLGVEHPERGEAHVAGR